MAEKTGAGGKPQDFDSNSGRYIGNGKGYNSQSDLNNLPNKKEIKLSKEEYAVLRKEVMRKNSSPRGRVKPTNFAFTSDYFYVYSTIGDDSFNVLVRLNIEDERDEINQHLNWFKE